MIVSMVAIVAEIGFAEESSERIASVVVIVFLDESNDLARGRGGVSHKSDHVRWIDGQDFDLMVGQSGLKSCEFGDCTGSFGDSSKLVKFLGFSFLDGASLFEVVVVLVACISVSVRQGFHGDDGPGTTEVVLILDSDAGPFRDTANGSTTRLVSFSVSTAWPWGAYEGGFHAEGVVGGEFFVGIEFGREGLEIGIQSFATFREFTYGEGGGLECVREGTGLHGEVDRGMRCQGVVIVDLSLNGPP